MMTPHFDGSLSTPEVMTKVAKRYSAREWNYLSEHTEFQRALLQYTNAADVHIVARRLLRKKRKENRESNRSR